MQLVAGDREQMTADAVDVERNLSCGLHCVGVERDSRLCRNFADGLYGLKDTRFVVRHDHGNQPSVRTKGLADVIRVDYAVSVHRHERDRTSHFLEAAY